MKLASAGSVLSLVLSMASCKKPVVPPKQVTTTCACDEFPFPAACNTQCETGQVQIESVDTKQQTAMVVIRHGTMSESHTIPLDRLPAGVPAERGAKFTALLKKEAAAASAPTSPAVGSPVAPGAGPAAPASAPPKIVRFTRKP